jgi:hypothetical protein
LELYFERATQGAQARAVVKINAVFTFRLDDTHCA